MSHRMQITLEDQQYERLAAESQRTGASIAELVRQAVDDRFDLHTRGSKAERFRAALGTASGVWADRAEDGLTAQRRMRAPLLERRSRGAS